MIEIKNLGKSYQTKDGLVEALTDVSLQIEDGDIKYVSPNIDINILKPNLPKIVKSIDNIKV